MINTIFYFPESLTYDLYLNALDKKGEDGIASRTIVLAKRQRMIYNNGAIFGSIPGLVNYEEFADTISTLRERIELTNANLDSVQEDLLLQLQQLSEFSGNYDDLSNKPTIDAMPTEESTNAVSSNGVFSSLSDIGKDINLYTRISGTEVSSNNPVTPDACEAGDIFYINKEAEGDNYSGYVNGIMYYIAKGAFPAEADLTDASQFDNTYSGAEALNIASSYKRGIADSALQGSIDDINQIINDAVVKVSMGASSTPVAAGGTSYISLTASANIPFASIVIEKGGSQIGSGTNTKSLQITDTNVSTTGSTTYNATFTKQGMTKTTSINVWAIYYGVGDTSANGQNFFVIKSGLGGTYNIVNDILQYLWFYIPSALSTSQPSATMGGFEFPLTADGDVTINGVSYKAYRSTARQNAGTYSIKLA